MNSLRSIVVLMVLFSFMHPASADTSALSSKDLPQYEAVMSILAPLEYSGFPTIVDKNVALKVDFDQHQWRLNNVHQFDDKGSLILEQGRFGLCAELSAHIFDQIKALMGDEYEVKFATVTESSFFSKFESNHIILLVYHRITKASYFIDPSFRMYGKVSDFNDYRIFSVQDQLPFVRGRITDSVFKIDQAMPLFIKNDCLLSFAVTSVDGKFDKDNFLFIIALNRKNKFSGIDIFAVGKYKGGIQSVNDHTALEQLFTPDEIKALYNQLNGWFKAIL